MKGDCNICINGKMPSYSATCVECGLSRKNYKPLTNADRIRGMTDEELADWVWGAETDGRAYGPRGKNSWLDWLKEEAVSDG